MLPREENELITRVGPGTPMGNTMRRYWIPALLSSEIAEPDCAPVRVRLRPERQDRLDPGRQVHSVRAQPRERCARLFVENDAPRLDGVVGHEPAGPRVGERVRVGDVRLEIEHRRSVERVEAYDVQRETLDPFEPGRAHPDGVGTTRRARREYTLLLRASRRQHLGPPSPPLGDIAVEDEKDPQAIPMLEPFERVLEAVPLAQLDARPHVETGRGLTRRLEAFEEGRSDETDGLEAEFARRHGHRDVDREYAPCSSSGLPDGPDQSGKPHSIVQKKARLAPAPPSAGGQTGGGDAPSAPSPIPLVTVSSSMQLQVSEVFEHWSE